MSADNRQQQRTSGTTKRPMLRRLGFWVLLIGISFLIASRPLQDLINASVEVDTTASMVWGTIVWALWMIWLLATVSLLVIWVFKKVRRSRS